MFNWRKAIIGGVMAIAALGVSMSSALAAAPQNAAVVYYTLLHNRLEGDENGIGKTQRVAMEIAKQTNSQLFDIKNVDKYPAAYGDTTDQARDELDQKVVLPMAEPVDVSAYKDIYIGMPCWWSSYPRVFASFFQSQDFSGKNIYVFVTHGGSRYGRIINDMKEAMPGANVVPLLEMYDSDAEDYDDAEMTEAVQEALGKL